MKAVLVHKNDAMNSPGGGEVQLFETAIALERLGVETEVCASGKVDLASTCADVYHFFGTVPEFLPVIERITQKGSPCLLSTIAWYDPAAYWHESDRFLKRFGAVARFGLRAVFPWLPSWRRRLYRTASLLLPNSEVESRQLGRYFSVPKEKIRVVHNGVDPRFAIRPSDEHEELPLTDRLITRLKEQDPDFDLGRAVLCVGRFEPRKNQLGLIRALHETDYPLLFLGGPVPGQEDYYQQCRLEAAAGAVFLGPIDHDDPILAEAYAGCACLVLPSRFETPGLVALEAALTGTPLVLTARGCTYEYFGDLAEYVSPYRLGSLRQVITQAIDRGRQAELIEQVLAHYTWEKVAHETLDVYHEVTGL